MSRPAGHAGSLARRRSLAPGIATALAALPAAASGYLLVLLAAAAAPRRREEEVDAGDRGTLRFLVLVPAHDEEDVIEPTLRSLAAFDYPRDRVEVVVIADNCADATAAVAAGAGATVLERDDPSAPGKGRALAWALDRLLPARPDADAVVVVDADCTASADLLTAFERRLRAGAAAVQARYVVANPEASAVAALRYAGFALVNAVRPLGKARLGLSAGLLGTGMAFSRALLERRPWEAFTLAEDLEHHLRLVDAGERVAFAGEAAVASPMPATLQEAADQQLRWEGGRWAMVRRWAPRLAAGALRTRDPQRLHAALELLVPPQAVLGAASLGAGALAAVAGSRAGLRLAVAALAGQAVFVAGGQAVAGAPPAVYRAFARVPLILVDRLGVHLRLLAGRGPEAWVRTSRRTTR